MKPLRLALALLTAAPAAAVAQRSIVLERYDVLLFVQPDGDVQVTETIHPHFSGSWNGIYRDLSLEHRTAQDQRRRLQLDVTGVTDSAGAPLKVESSARGLWTRRLKIWVPGASNATRTVVIHYVVHNAIRFFEPAEDSAYDELYWNATGNEWVLPIEHATARVVLPGVDPLQFAAYTGRAGSKESAVETRASGSVVEFRTTRALAPGEGLTVAVGWPPGAVARPAAVERLGAAIAEYWPLLLPLLAFAFGYSKWRRNGRDPAPHAITVQYEPPDGLRPAEVGTLIDNHAEMHDLTSTLVDLAVRGYVHIEKREEHVLGVFPKTEYVFHLKKPREDWQDLREHERRYLEGVFEHASRSVSPSLAARSGSSTDVPSDGSGAGPTWGSVELSSLKNRFYREIKGIKKAIYRQLMERGYYVHNPETVKEAWIGGAVITVVLAIAGAGWFSDGGFLPADPLTFGAAGVAAAVVLFVFALIMPARTVQGARTRERSLGFREFLDRVEEDRYRRMITSPEMFERYLPFAMAFRVEEKWAKAFQGMFTEPPRWYSGYGGSFNASSFSHDMHAMSSAASSTMSSSPSGSGGGGGSGGGSGGGGGGGF